MGAIDEIGGELRGMNPHKSKWLSQIYNLWLLRRLVTSRQLIFETYPVGNRIARFLIYFNRKYLKGIRVRTIFMNRPRRFAKNTVAYYEAIRGNTVIKNEVLLGYDYLLLSHPLSNHEEIHNVRILTDARVINIGYTKGLPYWRGYLDQVYVSTSRSRFPAPYVFFPLSAVGQGFIAGENSVSMEQKLRESLSILREYNSKIHTVFKPHFKTDLGSLKRMLEETGYSNYSISYLHPDTLCRDAMFTFSYHSTSVFIDSYFHGCTTVEYADYDTRFIQYNEGRARYLDAITYFSHRDPEKLRGILNTLIHGFVKAEPNREKLADDFFTISADELESEFSRIS